jgi:DNA helicase-2/ATP-dependent DNA helicase PcrA
VGDDAQSIYGFRGADIGNILSFEEHYPKAKVIMLEQNYRSTQTILDTADAIIKNNEGRKEKKLWTSNPGGEKIFYHQAFDGDGEARFVAQKIDEHRRRNPKDKIAILYRTNAQSRLFEEALRRNRIEYNIVGGFSFYERAEVKDVIAYLKMALNPFDDIALLRVINTPTRGFGKTSLDELQFRARDFGVSYGNDRDHYGSGVQRKGEYDAARGRIIEKIQADDRKSAKESLEVAETDRKVSDVVIAAMKRRLRICCAPRTTDESERGSKTSKNWSLRRSITTSRRRRLRDFIDHAALTSDTDKFDRNAAVTMMTVPRRKAWSFRSSPRRLEDGIFRIAFVNDRKNWRRNAVWRMSRLRARTGSLRHALDAAARLRRGNGGGAVAVFE